MEIKVGDVIKSMNFPGNENHYMVGEVYFIKDEHVFCNTKKVVVDGVQRYEGLVMNRTFQTVTPGSHFMDSQFPGRISLV